jgi:hypothetical protein
MSNPIGAVEELHVTTLDIDGRTYNVSVHVEFDGLEHIGHVWFTDADWDDDEGLRDHGVIPGRSSEEVRRQAQALPPHDLALRYRRAMSEKRRYHGLRRVTDDVLSSIRYLNKVATSMRAGLLDVEEAAAEIDSTEQKLHEMIGQLRNYAGVLA